MIGSLGKIVFRVTNDEISTFNNLSETYSAKWETHETKRPEQEFIISELAKYSFTIPTNIRVGTNPEITFKLLNEYCSTGEVINFILNGKKFRGKTYILKGMKVSNKEVNNRGQIISANYDVELEEYGGDRKPEIEISDNVQSKNTYKKSETRKNNINYKTGGVY